ncbi:MAG: hypothetical protein P1V51_06070 [Deltaproteobacteria bacterium]|nr:hypothetical protein [Deltaproteobacteria bacterium]
MQVEARYALREKFEARLRAALVRDGHVSPARMKEALDRQVVHGAHLATNLWELGFVEGKVLTRVSCELLGITAVAPQVILLAKGEIFRLLPVHFIQQHQILPFFVEGRTLHVAMAEPWDLPTVERAAHHCGLAVRQHFLGEVPMARVLHRVLGLPISARFELGRRLFQQARRPEGAPTGPQGDLIDESEFNALYASHTATPLLAVPPVAPLPPEPELSFDVDLELDALDELDLDESGVGLDEPILELKPEDMLPVEADVSLVPIEDLAEATALLEAATSRRQVGEVMVRFCLSRGERVALLTLDGTFWAGWTGTGVGVDVRALESLMVPAEEGTVFGLVASTGAHFLGPLLPHRIHKRFLSVLGEGEPTTVGFFPVRYRGRVVFGVYLDGGGGRTVSVDIAEILLLAQRVPGALEKLVQRRLER